MKREIKTIDTVDGGKLPYICTNNVLARLQSAYGSIDAFYLKLIGRKIITDEDGDARRDDKGRRITKNCEPDIATANVFLTEMVNEALEMQGQPGNMSVGEVVRLTDQPVYMRIAYLADAFDECFNLGREEDGKKSEPGRKKK